jgi:hypothetical protein
MLLEVTMPRELNDFIHIRAGLNDTETMKALAKELSMAQSKIVRLALQFANKYKWLFKRFVKRA